MGFAVPPVWDEMNRTLRGAADFHKMAEKRFAEVD